MKRIIENRLLTTRCSTRDSLTEGYIVKSGNLVEFEPLRFYNKDKPPTEHFYRGHGWRKKIKAERILVTPVHDYNGFLALCELYPVRAAIQIMGFDFASYGDAYPIQELKQIALGGKPAVEWLNRIAEIDYKIMKWFETELKVTFNLKDVYDMWMHQGDEETHNAGNGEYECTFRVQPFLGFSIETLLMGIMAIPMHIDPMRFEKELLSAFVHFHPKYKNDKKEGQEFFDNTSCKELLSIMAGPEDAEWMHKHLHSDSMVDWQELIKNTKDDEQ